MGIMLVYDITQEKSFENIKNWIRNIEENASTDVEKMLLGNKCELNEKRQVTKERGEQLAVEYGIKFLETSAKNSINVEEAFFTLARDIKIKMEKRLVRNFWNLLLKLNFNYKILGSKQSTEGSSAEAQRTAQEAWIRMVIEMQFLLALLYLLFARSTHFHSSTYARLYTNLMVHIEYKLCVSMNRSFRIQYEEFMNIIWN